VGELGIPLFRPYEDDFGEVLAAPGAVMHVALEKPVLGKQRHRAEKREEDHDHPAQHRQLEEIHRGHNGQRANGAALIIIHAVLRRRKVWARL